MGAGRWQLKAGDRVGWQGAIFNQLVRDQFSLYIAFINLWDGRVDRDSIRCDRKKQSLEPPSFSQLAISNPKIPILPFSFLKTSQFLGLATVHYLAEYNAMLKVGQNSKQDTGLLKQLMFSK